MEIAKLVEDFMANHCVDGEFPPAVPPEWPLEAWSTLSNLESEHWDTESLHFWLAGQAGAPAVLLRRLATSRFLRVRWRVARRRTLPEDLFAALADDADEGVRNSVAENEKTPRDVLRKLEADASEAVRRLARSRSGSAPRRP